MDLIKHGSQDDTGAASITSFMSDTGKLFANCIPDVKFFDNLIGWTMANACDATLE